MTRVRAKFRVISETRTAFALEHSRLVKFQAMYDPSLPEDQRFAKATPSGSLEIHVDNPDVHFELGQSYYLDFTPADES